VGGFPKELQKLVLKGKDPIIVRPGELLPPEDLEKARDYLERKYEREFSMEEILSYIMYPKVFEDYLKDIKENGDNSRMNSHVFFHGLRLGETAEVHIDEGKILVISLLEIGEVDKEGNRTLLFEVNDSTRAVKIRDSQSSVVREEKEIPMADPSVPGEVGASIPGRIAKLLVKQGQAVKKNQTLFVLEAMKMETEVASPTDGIVKALFAKEGQMVASNELVVRIG